MIPRLFGALGGNLVAGKFVKYQRNGEPRFARLEDRLLLELERAPWHGERTTGVRISLDSVQLLCPCEPRKIFAVGLNYRSHLGDRKAPKDPEIFLKPVSCLLDPEAAIVIPRESTDAHFEGELVAVIGSRLKRATRSQAAGAIFGLTCGNDVSDRNWQRGPEKDLQWWRAKGADTFGPLGPVIATGLDPVALRLETRVNGETLQNQSTSDLLFDVPAVAAWISQWVTLEPGDVIFTGTPGNTRKLNPGDVVEVEIEGIGVLKNEVRAEGE